MPTSTTAPTSGAASTVWGVLHFVGFLLPYLVILGSYVMFPELRYRVGDTIPADENIYRGLFFATFGYVGWWVWDFVTIIKAKITGAQLKFTVFVGMINTFGIIFLAGY